MPSSYHGFISEVLSKVLAFGPTSVLDVGSGFGKWGVLFREYLDVFWGRCTRRQWVIRIDGIETVRDRLVQTVQRMGNPVGEFYACDLARGAIRSGVPTGRRLPFIGASGREASHGR